VVIDDGLIERFRSGDRDAFAQIYRAHAPSIRALIARFFGAPLEQEEALQETWLLVYRHARTYDLQKGELGPWLRSVATNRCKELLRAKGRRPDASEALGEDMVAEMQSPEATTMGTQVRAALARFVETLPPEERLLVESGLFQGKTHEELSSELSIPVRRCKYLKKKVLDLALGDATLQRLVAELRGEVSP
jgi:RNA polymerase sigma factor (sigma-70 family)